MITLKLISTLWVLAAFFNPGNKPSPAFSIVPETPAYYRTGYVKTWELTQKGTSYGHEVRISRNQGRAKAKYFASGDVYGKYLNWKAGKDVIMVCSGAFTNGTKKPVGLTVDNGEIVNKILEEKMDGLVVVYATGGIAVSDLDERDLYLGSLNRHLNLRNETDRNIFLKWAVDQEATVFQTQLLVFDEKIRFQRYRPGARTANRRFLVLAKDASGELFHLIVKVDQFNRLGESAFDTNYYLKYFRNMEIIAMLNLDTGSYDAMEFYDDRGRSVYSLKSDVPLSESTNLIAYYYE